MSRTKAILIILALGLIRVLRPIIRIRFGTLFVSRLGHLTGNTECFLCERDEVKPKCTFDIWIPQGKPANEQILKMYGRVIPIWRGAAILNSIGQRWSWWREHHQFTDAQWGRDIHNVMEKHPPHLKFTKAEEKRGQELLRAMGIPEGAKWVCIINRDPLYLKVMEPQNDYSYHSFRDSNIQNYREAAAALIERGYWVIRMGRIVSEPMKLRSERFIDYAVSEHRSDFADTYLGAKCEFCISNGTGFDGIPMVFRRPICFVNEAPFEYLSTWMPNSLAIWKHHVKDGKRMTPAEIAASGAGLYFQTQQYEKAGITLIENTPEEIRDVALEIERMPNTGVIGFDSRFWDSYPRSKSPHNGIPLHGKIRLKIGTKFLASYAN